MREERTIQIVFGEGIDSHTANRIKDAVREISAGIEDEECCEEERSRLQPKRIAAIDQALEDLIDAADNLREVLANPAFRIIY